MFFKKVSIKTNPIQNIVKWMFLCYKCYISIELTFLKELTLIKQMYRKSMSDSAILNIKGSDYCLLLA